jgi:prepilin-type N-terminal cleavage/methylation domain-containing protein
MAHRPGFSLFELIFVIGILGIIGGVAIPTYRDYQIRSDLDIAAQQVSQAVTRARILAQSGREQSAWGFKVQEGVLYKGTQYSSRDTAFDEAYPMPSTIVASGLSDVSFSPIEGFPSATGTVILTTISGEQRNVVITINREGIATNESDKVTICHCASHTAETKEIPESAWGGHQQHGDHLGVCSEEEEEEGCEDD